MLTLRCPEEGSIHKYDIPARQSSVPMCAKVLILSGSPRKNGNTEILCDRFAEGARDAGHHVEMVRVCDKDIHYCTGCDSCVKSGRCVFRDDMEEIRDRMMDSDVIVFASPVYFYTISAQIKTLIDRMVPFYTQLHDKSVYIIITAADPDPSMLELAVESFRGLTRDCMEGAIEKGVIKATGVWEKGAVEGTEFPKMAYQRGRSVE